MRVPGEYHANRMGGMASGLRFHPMSPVPRSVGSALQVVREREQPDKNLQIGD